jgi:ABC-2 type transport system ATP-binding protein
MTDATDDGLALLAGGLVYSYKRTRALSGLSFKVAPRSIHGFVGPNGAGKTTTLKILATLLKPQAGRAFVFGQDVTLNRREVRRRIGFMPDSLTLYRRMTVFECLDFFAAAYGLATAHRTRVINDLLTLTDMGGRRDDLISSLSRGMQQRLSLARALVHDPDLLLLDEPASGLDPRARIELMEILKELSRMGKTVFISSHILSELADLCDSVTIIDRGVARFSGPMAELGAMEGERVAFRIELAEASPAVEAVLGALDGGAELVVGETRPVYTLTIDRDTADANRILGLVIENGGRVVSFRREVLELSAAFMKLTSPGVPS